MVPTAWHDIISGLRQSPRGQQFGQRFGQWAAQNQGKPWWQAASEMFQAGPGSRPFRRENVWGQATQGPGNGLPTPTGQTGPGLGAPGSRPGIGAGIGPGMFQNIVKPGFTGTPGFAPPPTSFGTAAPKGPGAGAAAPAGTIPIPDGSGGVRYWSISLQQFV